MLIQWFPHEVIKYIQSRMQILKGKDNLYDVPKYIVYNCPAEQPRTI
jgi:hypothetical protein